MLTLCFSLAVHVHNTILFVLIVRNTIIVIFKYLQQSYNDNDNDNEIDLFRHQ